MKKWEVENEKAFLTWENDGEVQSRLEVCAVETHF